MAIKLDVDVHNEEEMQAFALKLVEKMRSEKKSLQEVLEIDDSLLEEIYSLGYNYYEQGRYKEALSLFYFISGAAPKNPRYMFSLSSAFHQTNDYTNAILTYWLALKLDPANAFAAYYLSDCFLKINDKNAAKEALDLTINIAGEKEEHRLLKERCLLIKKSLN